MRRKKNKNNEGFDSEVMKQIEKQLIEKQEIENIRKKRIWIFWSLILSGAVVITAAVLAFLFFLLEW